MNSFVIFILCMRCGLFQAVTTFKPTASGILETSNEGAQLRNNVSPDPRIGTSDVLDSKSSSQLNSSSTFGNLSQSTEVSVDPSTHEVPTLTEIFANESQSPESSNVAKGGATTVHSVAPLDQGGNGSTPVTDDDSELEGVARGKPSTTEGENSTTTSAPETIYQKTLALISDTYTMSIIIPVAAGIVFASTIIVIIATCRCLRRKCRRRRLRRKALPDSVKSLRPSDRARLLTESSDEEF